MGTASGSGTNELPLVVAAGRPENLGLEAWWNGGTAPMLLVQGLDDRMAPPGNGRALKDEFGERVDLVEIPNAGHMLLLEQPQAVVDAVLSFVSDH